MIEESVARHFPILSFSIAWWSAHHFVTWGKEMMSLQHLWGLAFKMSTP